MANSVSITSLREYAERMNKPVNVVYRVDMTARVRDWFLKDLEQRAAKVTQALQCDTLKEKTRILRQREAEDILAVYEAIEKAEVVTVKDSE